MTGSPPNKKKYMWKAINKKVVASREKLIEQTPKRPQAFMYSMVLQRQHFAYQHRERERECIARSRYWKQTGML